MFWELRVSVWLIFFSRGWLDQSSHVQISNDSLISWNSMRSMSFEALMWLIGSWRVHVSVTTKNKNKTIPDTRSCTCHNEGEEKRRRRFCLLQCDVNTSHAVSPQHCSPCKGTFLLLFHDFCVFIWRMVCGCVVFGISLLKMRLLQIMLGVSPV